MTKKQFNAFLDKDKKPSKNKFNAKKVEYNGRLYDSTKEAKRSFELDALKRAGEIKSIEYQPRFDIIINDKKVCKYFADFRVEYPDGRIEIEDAKGYKKGSAYAIFRLKKKLVKAMFDVDVIEV